MIDKADRKLILDLVTQRIAQEEFASNFPLRGMTREQYVLQALKEALNKRDADEVEYALILAFRFPAISIEHVPTLKSLIVEDWHKQHENIASILQKLKDPGTVDALYATALAKFPYLEYDDARALAVKCIWALSAIGDEAALKKLKLLAQSENSIIRESALKQLRKTGHSAPSGAP